VSDAGHVRKTGALDRAGLSFLDGASYCKQEMV
jgi:hypothetical protein